MNKIWSLLIILGVMGFSVAPVSATQMWQPTEITIGSVSSGTVLAGTTKTTKTTTQTTTKKKPKTNDKGWSTGREHRTGPLSESAGGVR